MIGGIRMLRTWRRGAKATADRGPIADPSWRLVVSGWLLLSAGALGFVLNFGQNAPVSDEWAFLAELTGEHPLGPWLLDAHNEHRYPLPRAVWIAAHRLTGYDFRAGMLLSVGIVSAAALALLGTAQRLRGRASVVDLLIPSLLLHLGHWENWLIGYQVTFTLVVGLTAFILAMLAGRTNPPSARSVAAAGLAVALLPLCGGAGVLFALPLTGWVVLVAGSRIRQARRPLCECGLLLFPIASALFVGAYISSSGVGAARTPSQTPEQISAGVELLTGGLSSLGRSLWPASGVMVAGLFVGTGVFLTWVASRRVGEDRCTAIGLLAVLSGTVAIAGAIGFSRGGMFPGVGFSPRYALFSSMGLIAIYLATLKFVPLVPGRIATSIMVAFAVAIVVVAVPRGIAHAEYARGVQRTIREGVVAGVPPAGLVRKNTMGAFIATDDSEARQVMIAGLEVCLRHRIGPYRRTDRLPIVSGK